LVQTIVDEGRKNYVLEDTGYFSRVAFRDTKMLFYRSME